MQSFLRVTAYNAIARICHANSVCPSVCPSVHLSHTCFVSKRLNASSKFFHCLMTCFMFCCMFTCDRSLTNETNKHEESQYVLATVHVYITITLMVIVATQETGINHNSLKSGPGVCCAVHCKAWNSLAKYPSVI